MSNYVPMNTGNEDGVISSSMWRWAMKWERKIAGISAQLLSLLHFRYSIYRTSRFGGSLVLFFQFGHDFHTSEWVLGALLISESEEWRLRALPPRRTRTARKCAFRNNPPLDFSQFNKYVRQFPRTGCTKLEPTHDLFRWTRSKKCLRTLDQSCRL